MNAATESGEMHMRDAIDGSSFSMCAGLADPFGGMLGSWEARKTRSG